MKYGEINTNYETHYTSDENHNYAIIYRKKGNLETHKCPFCLNKHNHGTLPGHRLAHCAKLKTIYLENGVELNNANGYYIKEY